MANAGGESQWSITPALSPPLCDYDAQETSLPLLTSSLRQWRLLFSLSHISPPVSQSRSPHVGSPHKAHIKNPRRYVNRLLAQHSPALHFFVVRHTSNISHVPFHHVVCQAGLAITPSCAWCYSHLQTDCYSRGGALGCCWTSEQLIVAAATAVIAVAPAANSRCASRSVCLAVTCLFSNYGCCCRPAAGSTGWCQSAPDASQTPVS